MQRSVSSVAPIKGVVFTLLAICLCGLLEPLPGTNSAQAADAPKAQRYTLGVFPYLPPRELERVFAPIAARFGAALGTTVQVRSSGSYRKFMEQLDAKAFDIVFVQPFDYVRIADNQGYAALATRDEPLAALVVVNANSPYKTIQDLRGKHLATPPAVAAVTYLVKAYLQDQGIDIQKDIEIGYHRSHMSCLQQVLIGRAAACATAAPALRFFTHKMDAHFNVIGSSTSIPHALFAVESQIDMEQRQSLLTEILSWPNSEAGRQLLSSGKFKPFRSIKDTEYDVVRRFLQRVESASKIH